MRTVQAVVIGVGCLLVGVVATRLVTNSSHRRAEEMKAETLAAEIRALKSRLGQLLEERIPSLESDLAVLRTAPRTENPKPDVSPTPTSQAKDVAGTAPTDAALKASVGRTLSASRAAALLGLKSARQKEFEGLYDRVLSQVQDAEMRHASVSRQGGEVEIHIPPFPDEAAALRQEWSGLLASALTPQEQERYQELQLDQLLFPREIGAWDRYMVFQPQNIVWPRIENGNRYWPTFYERWTRPGEASIDPSTRWAWGGPDAYNCYRHLLDPSECQVRED